MNTPDLFDPWDSSRLHREIARQRRDADAGKQLRDAGIARAVDHADQTTPAWSDQAYRLLRVFANVRPSLTTEELRKWAEACGFDLPPDNRAWGGIVQRARIAGVLIAGEYEPASDPKVHCRPVMRWRSTLYRNANQCFDCLDQHRLVDFPL